MSIKTGGKTEPLETDIKFNGEKETAVWLPSGRGPVFQKASLSKQGCFREKQLFCSFREYRVKKACSAVDGRSALK